MQLVGRGVRCIGVVGELVLGLGRDEGLGGAEMGFSWSPWSGSLRKGGGWVRAVEIPACK